MPPPCERCARSLNGLCRACARRVGAEHLYDVHESGVARVDYHGDVAHLTFAKLSPAQQSGWLEVYDAAREMEWR